ncbi:MAG: hypothetical protein ABJB16_03660 [Saprospiraceae bacterium]
MKKIIHLILLLPIFTHAQTPVTHSAGLGENVPSLACLACPGSEWNHEMNITTEDDSVASTVLSPAGNCFMSFCSSSRYLYAHHFNFSIPADATIDTILVDIRRAAYKENAIRDSILQLDIKGLMVGHNLSSTGYWPASLDYERYGHNDPLWGATWLPSDLNDTTMGVALKIVNRNSENEKADVDHIQMTVYFSTSTGIYSVTSSPSEVEWLNSPGEIGMNIFTSSSVYCASKIINVMGQEMLSVRHGYSLHGENHFHWSTEFLDGGVYFIIMDVGGQFYSGKFVVVK